MFLRLLKRKSGRVIKNDVHPSEIDTHHVRNNITTTETAYVLYRARRFPGVSTRFPSGPPMPERRTRRTRTFTGIVQKRISELRSVAFITRGVILERAAVNL